MLIFVFAIILFLSGIWLSNRFSFPFLKVAEYKAEIKTIQDLIIFPLKYIVSYAEEYSDDAARRAYKERAEELGFTISKEMG